MAKLNKQKVKANVLIAAQFNHTVAEIVRETGAKPNTVRVVLQRAATKGIVHLTRFQKGRSSRAINVTCHDDDIESRLDALICGWCGKVAK